MASPLTTPPPTPEEIHRAKLSRVRGQGGGRLPSNVDWVRSLPPAEAAEFDRSVLRKPSRSLSGVAVVAVMTAPARCPHGRCTYCPGGVENASPQSYTGEEPSALRGAQFHWDSEAITVNRLTTLEAAGHPTSKVEGIVMGGTFPARPRAFQEGVLRGIYDGLNGTRSSSLSQAVERNEVAAHRMVGLTVETRPDWCDGRVLPFLLENRDSVVVIDPKGENAKLTAEKRRAMGQRVVLLDPFKVATQTPDCLNPLAAISTDSPTALGRASPQIPQSMNGVALPPSPTVTVIGRLSSALFATGGGSFTATPRRSVLRLSWPLCGPANVAAAPKQCRLSLGERTFLRGAKDDNSGSLSGRGLLVVTWRASQMGGEP